MLLTFLASLPDTMERSGERVAWVGVEEVGRDRMEGGSGWSGGKEWGDKKSGLNGYAGK